MTGFLKEIINIYTGLLSLQGHLVHDDALIAEAANDPVPADAATDIARKESQQPFDVLESVLFLGGRPMHPDQPYDREEPFEQLVVPQDALGVEPEACCA